MDRPLWSILIASIPSRKELVSELEECLEAQIGPRPVELITLYDNKWRSVGEKRNALLELAQGQYVSWVDDDDMVSNRYVEAVVNAIPWEVYGDEPILEPDVICFKQTCTHVETGYIERCTYSLKYKYESGRDYDIGTGDPMNSGWWRGKPAHTMVWRAEIAKRGRFPDGNFGEDVGWVQQVAKLARTEVQIPEVLYHYSFNPKTSETRFNTDVSIISYSSKASETRG